MDFQIFSAKKFVTELNRLDQLEADLNWERKNGSLFDHLTPEQLKRHCLAVTADIYDKPLINVQKEHDELDALLKRLAKLETEEVKD